MTRRATQGWLALDMPPPAGRRLHVLVRHDLDEDLARPQRSGAAPVNEMTVGAGVGPELSVLIPVYNSERTLAPLVAEVHETFAGRRFEVVLVNDGSTDDSEAVCGRLVEAFPGTVRFVQLARNFGEHNAVLAGLQYVRGNCVAILDDDGQHPPGEALRLYEAIRSGGYDVIYGRYTLKQHSWGRNLGSWLNDRLATLLLQKPSHLYLSSFKVMNRFLIDEVKAFRGSHPYIDGIIYRTTRNIGQPPRWAVARQPAQLLDPTPASRRRARFRLLAAERTSSRRGGHRQALVEPGGHGRRADGDHHHYLLRRRAALDPGHDWRVPGTAVHGLLRRAALRRSLHQGPACRSLLNGTLEDASWLPAAWASSAAT
jgi:hypothetical protein